MKKIVHKISNELKFTTKKGSRFTSNAFSSTKVFWWAKGNSMVYTTPAKHSNTLSRDKKMEDWWSKLHCVEEENNFKITLHDEKTHETRT
jgi:hypothetical protein